MSEETSGETGDDGMAIDLVGVLTKPRLVFSRLLAALLFGVLVSVARRLLNVLKLVL